jgi:hypothetical protein
VSLLRRASSEETIQTGHETILPVGESNRQSSAGILVSLIKHWSSTMLAEKFFLMLEALKRSNYPDGSPRVISTAPHIPVKLPNETAR